MARKQEFKNGERMSNVENNVLRVLHLEDNIRDAQLVHAIVEDAGIDCDVKLVRSREGYLKALDQNEFDLILCDYSLPSFNGRDALLIARDKIPEIPFIYVSGTIGEERAVQALLDGATDYVLKPGLARLAPAIRRAVREAEEKKKLKLAERLRETALAELRVLESKYRGVLQSAPDAAIIVDEGERIAFANKGVESIFGYSGEELIGKPLSVLIPKRFQKSHKREIKSFDGHPHARPMSSGMELYGVRKDGVEFPADIMLSPLVKDQGLSVLAMVRDLTESKKAEKALRAKEEKFRTIYEASPVAIVEVADDGKFLSCNPAAVDMFGYSEKELLEKTITDLKYPEDEAIVPRVLSELSAMKMSKVRFEKRFVRKNGNIIVALLTVSAVKDETNRMDHALMIIDDITDRRLAEEALRNSEERYRSLVDGVRDAIFKLSPGGMILNLNLAFARITGWRRDEWVGRSFTDLLHPADREKAATALKKVADGENSGVTEYRILTKSGSYLIGEISTAAQLREGKLIGFLGIARDVTEQKSLEEQLRQTLKLEGLGTLAGGIAHDFNNILAIITGYASFLRRTVVGDEKGARSVDAIETAASRATALVRQLLTFARRDEIVVGYLDVNEMVTEMQKLIGETFPKQIMIDIELHDGTTPVYGDRSQIHQLLLNLCVNARDAMMDREDGILSGGILKIVTDVVEGRGLRKRFPTALEKEYIRISVTDTGIGMDENIRKRIFEPFFTTKPQGKGTGLGLSTVYGIVQNHAGMIDVQSEPGLGTTFIVYLPAHSQVVTEQESTGDASDFRGGNETILVVEDEPELREYLDDLLTAEGYRVLTAQDGEKAISLFLSHDNIDLVLSDIGLPKIGGIDLMESVRTMKPNTSVILASGYLDESERRKMAQKGVDSFIQKPYKRGELLKRIRSALDQD